MRLRAFPGPGILVLLLAGCAAQPRPSVPAAPPAIAVPAPEERIARRALDFVGLPYRYGGNGPEAFDCSGLVRYLFAEQGVSLPRTSEAQIASAERVAFEALRAGDLVFFRIPEAHIGIYLGDGRFVHAPASGRAVSVSSLDEPWFRRAFVAGGRVGVPVAGRAPDLPATSPDPAAGAPVRDVPPAATHGVP